MTQPQEPSGRLLADRYRLGEVLGRGGMGTVWRAEDELLGRIVAVKELRMTGTVDEIERHRLVARTRREAKAAARIRHTAAVTVYDVVEEDDRPWIVMELVAGRSLSDVVGEDGPLTPRRAAAVALDLLGVLGAAHRQGVLHRDVKPSNVLIGEDGRTVLTDFGIASVEGDTAITSTGMLVGAPSYIAPERARGRLPGPPSDLWSLGGTLYAMVEGVPPYDRGDALATLTAVMTEPLPVPRNAGPLRPVIEGLLEKDPDRRMDADTARPLLELIAAGKPLPEDETLTVPAPPPVPAPGPAAAATVETPPAERPAGRDRRRGALVGGAVLAVLALVAALVVFWPEGKEPDGGGSADAALSGPADPTGAPLSAPASAPASASATPGESAAPSPALSPGQTPPGYTVYKDPSGFSITLPDWLANQGQDYRATSRRFEGRGLRLVIDWQSPAGDSALKDWQESDRNAKMTNYRKVRVESVAYRDWANAADWEWTYTGKTGTLLHSLNRGFVTGGGTYGYAIYWTMPEESWSAADGSLARRISFESFQPAP
ncbi:MULTISPECIES: serine/threonine-protein kinase [Kitasatospora]|uniref:non-specific serine/threonine protein kinase n=1 Tax=Kitasatospora setae (strain ATCC 33774 / DSM 43861 / JCM 3304 / KCC A-0304 / NBRC 14216 / KM-6054) TaxID=452652 RepID=E4NCI1_KITSK|nr:MULTISPECIES: serine/threonine-protein kinase [Kitasatospora]BAJ28912.1 putative serine/threonine protein kinase [Kitasatospora setae KM-6054]